MRIIEAIGSSGTIAGTNVASSSIVQAEKYLHEMNEAWHPLFAALVGRALRENPETEDYRAWSRSDLIRHYLSGTERTPWKKDNVGEWASCFIAVATAHNSIPLAQPKKVLPKDISFRSVQNICQRITSSRDRDSGKFLSFIA